MPNSTAPLAKKLQLRPGMRGVVIGAPPGFLDALDAPAGVTLGTRSAAQDHSFGLAFARDQKQLADVAPKLVARIAEDAMAWVAWPKKSSSMTTDLTRDSGWDALWETGWEGVALISIDDDWSAWRIRPSATVKRNPRAMKAIAERDAARGSSGKR